MLGSLFSILLLFIRITITGKRFFLFMLWNLFLAFVPWLLCSFIEIKRIRRKRILIPIIICWIIFFPNAPYILTDLIHLKIDNSAPSWFDLILLLSFGFTGLMYGFVSLKIISGLIPDNVRKIGKDIIITGLIYVSSFGIYLGRFLRWNSWDLVNRPLRILKDVVVRVADPLAYQTTWGFTLLFGTLLSLLYWGFEAFGQTEERINDTGRSN